MGFWTQELKKAFYYFISLQNITVALITETLFPYSVLIKKGVLTKASVKTQPFAFSDNSIFELDVSNVHEFYIKRPFLWFEHINKTFIIDDDRCSSLHGTSTP